MSSLRSFVFLFLTLCCAVVEGRDSSNIELYIYEAKVVSPSFAQISAQTFHQKFRPLGTGFRYQLSESVVWIKFRKREASPRTLFLELSSPNLHYADYYVPDSAIPEKINLTETGLLRNFSSQPVGLGVNVVPFQTTGEWCYIKIRSGHFLNSDVKVLTHDELIARGSNRIVFYSVYAGIMFIIIAGAILFIYHGRQFHYFYYAGYVLFISTINLTEKGFYFQFLWPDHPEINFYFPLLPYGVSFCLMLFLKKTFHIDSSSRWMYRFNLWIVTTLLLLLTTFYLAIGDYKTGFLFAEIHGLVSCFFIFVMNVRAYRKLEEYKPFLKLIIVGLGFFCTGVIVYLLSQNDVLPANFFTENMIVIGTALEVCFFTASLSLYQNSLSRKYYDLIAVQNETLQAGIVARTKELQQKNADLTSSLEEKENLMNIVAHDLRSPLNQTKALANLIGMVSRDNSETMHLLERMQTATDRGLKLIDELSAIAVLESDSKKVTFEKINVQEKLSPVLQNFASFAERKNIDLKVESCENCVVSTHPPYLIRIIENLLSNALKFSPFGSTVKLVIRKRETLEILVCDYGPGFSDDDMKKMFRKFQKLSALPTGDEHSTGLGLYIVKLLAERIQTELSLQSEFGRGSSFQIKFKD